MKRMILMMLVLGAAAVLNGCGPWQLTQCWEMTDGSDTGRHFDRWQKNDEAMRADFKPQVRSWWQEEKRRWPKFRRTCVTAESCYEAAAAEDNAKASK